jgi:DNA (cytosine-5)-methyltransferase 1
LFFLNFGFGSVCGMRVLNLYSGLGGNRRLWGDGVEVTAVEWDVDVAVAYSTFFPDDRVVVADAHDFLRDHFDEFDFVWSSPPCQSHSRARRGVRGFPDFRLYEEVVFLRSFAKERPLWVVENVVPFYGAFFDPVRVGRHFFWSNFVLGLDDVYDTKLKGRDSVADLELLHGFDLSGFVFDDARQLLRNCVSGELGRDVLLRVCGELGVELSHGC